MAKDTKIDLDVCEIINYFNFDAAPMINGEKISQGILII